MASGVYDHLGRLFSSVSVGIWGLYVEDEKCRLDANAAVLVLEQMQPCGDRSAIDRRARVVDFDAIAASSNVTRCVQNCVSGYLNAGGALDVVEGCQIISARMR